jgi:hypothetical protein
MDPIVEAALRKWPGVPHVYGWLALDGRGHWYLRDAAAQAVGPFPRVKGSRIEHAGLLAFIARNYAADPAGAWFFQNGPQRVYVDLEAAPWTWRLQPGVPVGVRSHTGSDASARAAWSDEAGRLFLDTDLGFGLVHSLDVELAAQALDAGQWTLQPMPFARMPERFGYRLRPRPTGG